MEIAISSAGIDLTDNKGDTKPAARSLLEIYRFEVRGFGRAVPTIQMGWLGTTPLEGWNTGRME
jgi:hypothetical protein